MWRDIGPKNGAGAGLGVPAPALCFSSRAIHLPAMTPEQTVGLVLALLVMALGCAGCILPGLPSTPLVLAAAIGHKLYFREDSLGWIALTFLVLITALAMVMDYLATVLGAKRFGATRKGMIGAIVGGLIGLFFSLPGIVLGPFIGAVAFELSGGRELKPAAYAGLGATLGLFAGAVGKLLCCFAMISVFLASWWWNALRQP
jgi:uncharacterized protein